MNDLHRAHNLAEASQAIAEGALHLGALSCQLHLVRPDGDLVVAAVAGPTNPVTIDPGEVSPRSAWEECLAASEPFGLLLRPIDPGETLPQRDIRADNPAQKLPMPANCVLAPLNPPGEPLNLPGHLLAGVLCLGLPPYGPALGAKERENLEAYALHAAIAIHHTRLRANMQHALVRLERDQSTLRASEESFRQAFDYAPSGMAIAEMGGDQHGKLLRANDALCRLLGRSASTMRRYSFSDLVHPEHIGLLLRTSAEGGRAELRLARRDGTYVWTSLRNSVVADNPDGPRYLLTHVEDIEERKNRELQLAHRASHDPLTGLPNSTELRARLSARLCARPQDRDAALAAEAEGPDEFAFSYGYGPEELASPLDAIGYDTHVHTAAPEENHPARRKGLAVIILGLDTFKSINDRFGTRTGDAALIEVARRLTSAVRDGDTVARLRGDEFAVLADGLSLRQAQDMMKHLRNAVISPIRFEGRALRVGVSFGISWASCGIGADEILRTTTEQMYAAKRVRNR
ncbi:diguanylate cyclase [Streptomyces sp. NPDC051976]|uniref:diguanylate cyclase domain-containing protein n=1 Tax=Streptomyces sp. NPDC051976 TaxID=3154947 RepID=UPI0034460D96